MCCLRSCLQYSPELKFVVGQVTDEKADFERWTKGERREMSRASQLALLAAEEAGSRANRHSIPDID